jgi:hypothetical protein
MFTLISLVVYSISIISNVQLNVCMYQALYKLWASEEFIAKSLKARENRGSGGSGHTYGPAGLCMSKRMVRKLIHSLVFVTNLYPQERESGQRPPDIKV